MNKLSVDFEERKAKTERFYEDFKEEHSLIPIILNRLYQNEVWLNKKIKIVFDRLFKEEARHMVASFKKYKDKAPLIFDDYVFSIPQRMEDLKAMLKEIEEYPLKTITKKVKKLCIEAKINHDLAISFIKKIKTTVINTVIKHAIVFETRRLQTFYEAEIKRINVDYYVANPAVKILTPNHYQKHVGLISNTVKAYGSDLQAFLVRSKYDYKTVWNFFDYLQQHIKSLHEYHQTMQISDDLTSTNLAS